MKGASMASPAYTIRTMSREEISIAVEWAAQEGWNPGLHDGDCFYAADPEGFLVGELNHEPIATISVVRYGETFGFLGFYITRPNFRGQGYGIQIWNAGMQRLSGRNIGLDGVVGQQENYKKSGFKLAYRNMRWQGLCGGGAPPHASVVSLSHIPFADIDDYDRLYFPERRSRFLQAWLQQPECVALGIVEHGKLRSYGVVRPCRTGYKIGPLYADHPELAEVLFSALTASVVPDKAIFLDTPERNREAVALAERHGMKLVFETARMYTGLFPALPLERLYGVTTFELG
jgi:hypothetical protein